MSQKRIGVGDGEGYPALALDPGVGDGEPAKRGVEGTTGVLGALEVYLIGRGAERCWPVAAEAEDL